MPFGFKFRTWGIAIDFVAGVKDELLESFFANTNSTDTANLDKVANLAEKVVAIGAGGAVCAETGNLVSGACSLVTKTSKGALAVMVTANLGEVLFSATPNLLF